MSLWERNRKDLLDFGRGFARICESLGEDSQGFGETLEEDLERICKTLEEDLRRRICGRTCKDS